MDANQNYAPEAGEKGADYITRVEALPRTNSFVLRAASILATAMDAGIYKPYGADKDAFGTALDHICDALKGFSAMTGLADAHRSLMENAVAEAQAITGKTVSIGQAKRMIGGVATTNLVETLGKAVGRTWAEIKAASGVSDNVNNREVVAAFKEETETGLQETDVSLLAQQVLSLRDAIRTQQEASKPKTKRRK